MPKSTKPLIHLAKNKANCSKSFRIRWFIKYGDEILDVGFFAKSDADDWIRRHDMEWRVDYLFRIKGDNKDIEIINKDEKQPKR
jgi:hypothetical protein